MTLTHERIKDQLRLYVEGELPLEESEQVGHHLRDCPSCRRESEQLRAILELLGADAPEKPLRPVWPHVEKRLQKAETGRLTLISGVAAAAGLLIAVFIGQAPEQSEWDAQSPLGLALSAERDNVLMDFTQTADTEGGTHS